MTQQLVGLANYFGLAWVPRPLQLMIGCFRVPASRTYNHSVAHCCVTETAWRLDPDAAGQDRRVGERNKRTGAQVDDSGFPHQLLSRTSRRKGQRPSFLGSATPLESTHMNVTM